MAHNDQQRKNGHMDCIEKNFQSKTAVIENT